MSGQPSPTPMLGMYVHQHWGYHHPYSARTWTLADWRGYAQGLSALGYNAIMLWPMLDFLPDPLTASDCVHLEKIRAVIDMLHQEFGMRVIVTMGPNVIGNEEAANYAFEERPYFRCDRRINPADAEQMEALYGFRRILISEYLYDADGFVMIDSDPGGYIGSTTAEFVDILRRHMAIFAEVNPSAYLYYWMWLGWETYNNFWADALAGKTRFNWTNIGPDCEAAVRLLMEHPEERWRLFCCMNDVHKPIIASLGLQERTVYNPYGLIEGEPTFPLTNYSPESIHEGLAQYNRELTPLGAFANAQNHILQLPNTYIWAHYAHGGTEETLNVAGFAEELFPGCGPLLTAAWQAMGGEDTVQMRILTGRLAGCEAGKAADGRYAGLLFGDPARYLADLAMQLVFRADLVDVAHATRDGADARRPLAALVKTWGAWQRQTGFADAVFGPVIDLLLPTLRALDDPAINQALKDNDDFHTPEVRHGVIPRLIAAIDAYVQAPVG
ncbi:MAG: hypothetical protein ACYDBB_25045 [Armatimonadota bacterium]